MGLAPQLVEEIFTIVKNLNEKEGVSFLLAEQNTNVALRFAHRLHPRIGPRGDGRRGADLLDQPRREGILPRPVGRGPEVVPRRALLPAPQALAELRRDGVKDMTAHYDDLETRSADERAAALAEVLPLQVRAAQGLPGYREALGATTRRRSRRGRRWRGCRCCASRR
jgi:hypothetical protein